MSHNKSIKYIPPNRSELRQFSKQVCRRLNISEKDSETVRGLCEFLGLVSSIEAKKLSSDGVGHE